MGTFGSDANLHRTAAHPSTLPVVLNFMLRIVRVVFGAYVMETKEGSILSGLLLCRVLIDSDDELTSDWQL